MEFRLLGSLEVGPAGAGVPIGAGKTRTLLAALLLAPNTAVSADQLIEALWGGRPPASAAASLSNHVMRLRRLLGDEGGARIRAVAPGGYLIQVEPGELDADTFLHLCADGRAAVLGEQWAKASADLSAALGLWRGAPFADVPDLLRPNTRIQYLLEARSQALEGRIAADLELGRHSEVIAELRVLTRQQPLREAFHGQLMLALYRAGRAAEALDVFVGLQRVLVDGLGVEPSPSIRELHRRILKADPGLARPAGAGRGPRSLLPADTREFTGREQELDELMELVRAAPAGTDAGMVVISAIDGMGGVGKTALAIRAAHRVREQFPDGQLFLDLHGYTAGSDPLSPGDALDSFLRSLGVPPSMIPEDLGARAAYYRDRLAGTRTLIVLDNAAGAAQVRPLLPSAPGCLVLITSRRRLAGLEDAHSLTLDVLPEADAIDLLHKVAGPGRVPAHHPAIRELMALCGHMPLAIRITAARLRRHPGLRIEDVVSRLRDETARLKHLRDEDRDLTAVFEASYLALLPAEQNLLRHLGLIPGEDFDAYAVACLLGTDRASAEHLLDSLLDHSLLVQQAPGRYRFHDLVRVYVRTLTGGSTAEEDEAALERLLDYYQHTALAADGYLLRSTRPGMPPVAAEHTGAPVLPDRAAALAWMRTERSNLVAAVAHAAATERPARVVALTAGLTGFLYLEGPWPQAIALHLAAATAAQEHGDRRGEANALLDLARIRVLTGGNAPAAALHERALDIYLEIGDRQGEANALRQLGYLRYLSGDFPAATARLEPALAIFQDLGDRFGQANTLLELGRIGQLTGDLPAARLLPERAVALFQDLGDLQGEAAALQDLGRVAKTAGDLARAADLVGRALAAFQELGSRHGEANAYWDLGRVRHAMLEYELAAELQQKALAIFQELGIRFGVANALLGLGLVRSSTGDHEEAIDLLGQALAIFEELGIRQAVANALLGLGPARAATGDHAGAAEALELALTIFQEVGDRQGYAETLNCKAALVAATTGPREAMALYREALRIAQEVDSPLDEAQAREGIARCAAQLGDDPTAATPAAAPTSEAD